MMNCVPRFVCCLLLLASLGLRGQETRRFRQWIAGQETGGMVITASRDAQGECIENRQWLELSRSLGTAAASQDPRIRTEVVERAFRAPNGSLRFQWRLSLSGDPMEGEGGWSPAEPAKVRLCPRNGEPKVLDLPAGVLLYPGDVEARLREAARTHSAAKLRSFSFSSQLWTEMELEPQGSDPLPGYPEAVRFAGWSQEGPARMKLEMWVSPALGELKQVGSLMGLPLVIQRADLPAPGAQARAKGFFESTLRRLPAHPFVYWLQDLRVRWKGPGVQALPEDPQQTKLGENQYRLRRAAQPSPEESRSMPITGRPDPEDAPFLAATPLVQHQDPVFKGLVSRLRPPQGATRWELARLVTDFVYDWIETKDLSVGFASAQEVARTARGDCTEHGVLAVAMLRRLGVPARGVTGLVAANRTMAYHFWVEVKLGQRWIPVDPTFDQAPASAFRLKLGASDLADAGSLVWENAFSGSTDGQWLPEGPWSESVGLAGDAVRAPDGTLLRVPGGHWTLDQGELRLDGEERAFCESAPRPDSATRRESKLLQVGRRQGWWSKAHSVLFVDLGSGRWLRLAPLGETSAFQLLGKLEVAPAP